MSFDANPTHDALPVTQAGPGGRPRRAPRAVGLAAVFLAAGFTAVVLVRPRRVLVAGSSMEPALREGDRLLVARTGRLRAGDLVALRDPADPARIMVKRVSAFRDGEVVVLGDNPWASVDSRSFGPVPRTEVLGRVIRRYSPAKRAGRI